MAKRKPARNKRKKEKHKANFGLTKKEWAKYQRENPQEAHALRMKVETRLAANRKTTKQ